MAKQFITLFGLSVALAFASGCGKSFEAIQRKDARPSSDDLVQQHKVDADNLKSDANKLLTTLKVPFIDASATSAIASEEIKGVSLAKRGGMFDFQAVVKGDEGTYQVIRAELPQPYRDGDAQYSIEGMIEVSIVRVDQEATDTVSNMETNQYSLVYTCTNACTRLSVYVQRVLNTTTAESGEVTAEGYAASFTFDIANDQGTLIFSTLSQNTNIESVEAALVKIQSGEGVGVVDGGADTGIEGAGDSTGTGSEGGEGSDAGGDDSNVISADEEAE